MKILSFNLSAMPTITVTFEKDNASTFSIELTLNNIQNVLLCSLEQALSAEEIKQMILLIRETVLTDEDVKKPIADNELDFDVFIKTQEKLYRFGLSNLDAEASVIEKENSEHVNMYAMTVKDVKNSSSNSPFYFTELSDGVKTDPALIQEIIELHFGFDDTKHPDFDLHCESLMKAFEEKNDEALDKLSNYPTFIKNWAPCLETDDDRQEFFKKLLNTNRHSYVVRINQKLVGMIMLTSSPQNDLHYLGNFVVAKDYRHQMISVPLLSGLADKLGLLVDSFVATFLTDNTAVTKIMTKIGINTTDAECPIDAAGQLIENIPTISAKSIREISSPGRSPQSLMPAQKDESVTVEQTVVQNNLPKLMY